MPVTVPSDARKFTAEEHGVIAGWLEEVAFYGFGAAVGTCEDGQEWLGVTLPGSMNRAIG